MKRPPSCRDNSFDKALVNFHDRGVFLGIAGGRQRQVERTHVPGNRITLHPFEERQRLWKSKSKFSKNYKCSGSEFCGVRYDGRNEERGEKGEKGGEERRQKEGGMGGRKEGRRESEMKEGKEGKKEEWGRGKRGEK